MKIPVAIQFDTTRVHSHLPKQIRKRCAGQPVYPNVRFLQHKWVMIKVTLLSIVIGIFLHGYESRISNANDMSVALQSTCNRCKNVDHMKV